MTHALQCPRCGQQVTVAEDLGQDRARCPHCEHQFVVPGITPAASDDDDWLLLDDAPPATGSADSPSLGDVDERSHSPAGGDVDWLADELPGVADSFPSPGPSNPPPTQPPAAQPSPTQPPAAQPIEYESEYRVKCLVCGSVTYAKATQAGKTVKCRDCYSAIKIPAPPKKATKPVLQEDGAESYRFEERPRANRPDDPFRKSAEELLRQASESDEKEPEPDFDIPRIGAWAASVFGVFLQPAVLFHWLVLSLGGSVAAFLAIKSEMEILVLGLFPVGFLFGALVVACGFAILESVSNAEESVAEWPVMLDPAEWLGTLVVALAATGLAGIPAWAFGQMVFGPGLVAVLITMFSIYLLFPFVLLSMLDMQSIFAPFSPEVSRSMTRCHESWGALYFSSGLLFVVLFLIYVAASLFPPPQTAVIAIFATVGIVFLYFAMLGRLAYQIGQSLNAPPMKNDIEVIRQRRPEDEDSASSTDSVTRR